MWFSVAGVERPHSRPDRAALVRGIAARLLDAETDRVGFGISAERDLFAFMPGFVMESGYKTHHDSELHHELLEAFDHHLSLFGVSSATARSDMPSLVFANDETFESGLAVTLVEHDVNIGASPSTITDLYQ